MAESSLSLTQSALEAETAFFLGWGRGPNYGDPAWSTIKQQGITDCVNSGLRMFYFPAPLPGEMSSYDWSFIRPMRTVLWASGSTSVALPDDFGGMEGDVRMIDSGRRSIPIRQTSEQTISQRYFDYPDMTGSPEYCAVRMNSTTSVYKGQRADLYLFPTADQDYTLEFQMYLNPDALSPSFPFALGGATHAETIRVACKAAAERDQNNIMQGPQYTYFIERLKASISLDRRNKGQTFGYNSDRGYNRGRNYGNLLDNTQIPITFDGTSPG